MDTALHMLTVGGLVVLSVLLKSATRRLGLSTVFAYLTLGVGLSLANHSAGWLDETGHHTLEFLGELGVFALLFHVGLNSDLDSLIAYLGEATPIWVGNMVFSGGAGWVVARYLLDFGLVPSLFAAGALTATSVGVSVAVWEENDRLKTPEGQLLVDVAEMDDLSGIIVMGLLLSIAPLLRNGYRQAADDGLWMTALGTTAWFFLKLLLFAAGCYLFSKYIEPTLTDWFESIEESPDPMISIAGVGVVIASIAALLGFSIAIGAFFAGLTYSRDPEAVQMEADFSALYDFFTPFFFIYIGLSVDPSALSTAWLPAGLLLAAAILGQYIGTVVGGVFSEASMSLIAVSMIPRAEIAMVIMQQGQGLGDWAVPPELFGGMVVVSMVTCLIVPLALRGMFGEA